MKVRWGMWQYCGYCEEKLEEDEEDICGVCKELEDLGDFELEEFTAPSMGKRPGEEGAENLLCGGQEMSKINIYKEAQKEHEELKEIILDGRKGPNTINVHARQGETSSKIDFRFVSSTVPDTNMITANG